MITGGAVGGGSAYRVVQGGSSVVASGVLSVVVPAGEEWEIIQISANEWVGTSPNRYPNLSLVAPMLIPGEAAVNGETVVAVLGGGTLQIQNGNTSQARTLYYGGRKTYPAA